MKSVLALVLALTVSLATAGEVVVYNQTVAYDIVGYTPIFEINRSMGRAWVEVQFQTVNGDGPVYENFRTQVKGLRFDSLTNEVVLEADGAIVVCAKAKKQLFNSYTLRPTGNCAFEEKVYIQSVDNGYEIEKLQKIKITLKY